MDLNQSSNRVINRFPPLNNITPFTRVDGWSFLEVMEGMRNYIVNTLVKDVDLNNELIVDQLNEWFEAYVKDFSNLKAEWQSLFDQFMANIVVELEALNDQAISNLIGVESLTRASLEEFFNELAFSGDIMVPVERFGAVGDGVADDYTAIDSAMTYAETVKGTVVFKEHKTYRISKTLSRIGKNVSLKCYGGGQATIFQNGQNFTMLKVEANPRAKETFLAVSHTINTNGWLLANTEGVIPGMYMEVMSSKSWYYDPRPESTDSRKSELHRVERVEGSYVFTADYANDGYDVSTESVSVRFYNPISVDIENINFKAVKPSYGANAQTVTGINISTANTHLINVSTDSTTYCGVFLERCYKPFVEGGVSRDSNYVTTGYGIQTYGCSYPLIVGRHGYGLRRLVDFSGANVVTIYGKAKDCVNHGGGRQSDGKYYGWGPNNSVGIQNFGFGSHGSADHSTYESCETHNIQIPYSLRGNDERIINAVHYGRTRSGLINLSSGSNLTVDGFTARSTTGGTNKDSSIYDGGGNINTRRADYFIRVLPQYDTVNSVIQLKGVHVEVQDRFINISDGAIPKGYMNISSSTVLFGTSSAAEECALLWHEGLHSMGGGFRWSIGGVRYQRVGGTGAVVLAKNLDLTGTFTMNYSVFGS